MNRDGEAKPRIAVVDAHVHFWDPGRLHYPWLDGNAALDRAFVPSQYPGFRDQCVDAVIFVEANCLPSESEREVAMVNDWARDESRIAGIVAYIDIPEPDVLDAQLDILAQTPRVVGVRHNIQGHVNDYCTQPGFVHGVRRVGGSGLPFDVCATADQLRHVRQMIEQCENTTFVLDHCGKPVIAADRLDRWSRDIEHMARLPNVYCKLSGLFTQISGDRDEPEIARFAHHVLATFGSDRIIYGSDWPVCTLAGSEHEWQSFVLRLTSHLAFAERCAIFAENARRVYRIS